MFELWTPVSDISVEGNNFVFNDQAVWKESWRKAKLPVRPCRDLVAEAQLLPQADNGVLIRGTLKGAVTLPCDRCAGLFEHEIDVAFETYEQIPDGEYDEEPRVRIENGELQLDMGAVLWEEFALTLPFKPLCSEDCKGVCPGCGKDLNTEKCECEQEEGDERLAVFRNLKIK